MCNNKEINANPLELLKICSFFLASTMYQKPIKPLKKMFKTPNRQTERHDTIPTINTNIKPTKTTEKKVEEMGEK